MAGRYTSMNHYNSLIHSFSRRSLWLFFDWVNVYFSKDR